MSRGRISSIISIIVGLLFVALGVGAIMFVLNTPHASSDDSAPDAEPVPVSEELVPKPFGDYTWEELGEIAARMEAAPDEAAARAIAQEFGLIADDGSLTLATHVLELDDGTMAEVRLVGVLHDTRPDTGTRAALTFMTSPIAVRRINAEATSAGGWGGSELRAWLSAEGIELFPDDLAGELAPVTKYANNMGKTSSSDDVTSSSDTLWLFSCREVLGDITWLEDEFDYYSDGEDAILNAEGVQYEAFAREGIHQYSDTASYLIMSYHGKAVPWWYRTPYAFEFLAETDDAFYQVTSTGYARAVNLANDEAGIVVGFCL